MVQVDVFWSYGLSAGLALAGAKELRAAPTWWYTKAFIFNLLWISCIFAPSGLYLLWNFPGWETMFVAARHTDIPAWLVTVFAITNVTQGLLGFYLTARFLKRNKTRAAIAQAIWAHVAMLLILVFGWDGSGYKRFLYAGTGEEWHQGVSYDWTAFFSSPVFFTLLGLGVIFIPTYYAVVQFLRKPTV